MSEEKNRTELAIEKIDRLDLNEELLEEAKELVRDYEEHFITSRTPKSIASACLYIAGKTSKYRITQFDVAQELGSSIPALRQAYKEIADRMEDLDGE